MPAVRSKDEDSEQEDEAYGSTLAARRSTRKRNKSGVACETFPSPVASEENRLQTRSGRAAARRSRRAESEVSSEIEPVSQSGSTSVGVKNSIPASVWFSEPITVSGITLRPTIAFDTFWRFAAERKAIDDRRRAGQPAPWTDDPILQKYFFCNTFRVLDKGCQFLIKEVIEKGPQDPVEVVFRVVLFNLFTKIETWELLDRELGPLTWASYNGENYRQVLARAFAGGMPLYTCAYIKPAPHFGYDQNFANHLCFLEVLMESELASRLLIAPHMADVYEFLYSFPSMGPFSAYQLMLGLSYTKVLNFHPNDFVVSGPGSISGMNKLFGKSMNSNAGGDSDTFHQEVMRYLVDSQDYHFKRLGLEFSGLGPQRLPMDIADIEHTLCEVDKYCRVAHPRLKGKRTNIYRTLQASAMKLSPAVLPKAWSHPARRTPRIRPEKKMVLEKRYVIDCIKKHRDVDGVRQYFVYWFGYPPSDATWEFESSLLHDAPAAVKEYLLRKH